MRGVGKGAVVAYLRDGLVARVKKCLGKLQSLLYKPLVRRGVKGP